MRRAGAAGLLAGMALALGACDKPAPPPGAAEADQVPRPEWRLGDRWVFRRTTPAGDTTVVIYRVTAVTAEGYTLQLGGLTPEVTETWTPDFHLRTQQLAGRPAARFEPAAMFFAWPLQLGKSWSQTFTFHDGQQAGQYVNEWRVGPVVESLQVLAGSFYVVRVERRGPGGQLLDTYWYTPRVRYWVKHESYAGGYVDELVEAPSGP
jgi:hypothetical protein